MKRLALAGALLSAVAILAPVALAYTSPGSPSGYINDFAHVLSAPTKQSLESDLTTFEQTTSNEITVAIIPSMGGDYIENYAVKLFAEWGIGKKQKDNGALLLLSIAERKMRIEVGYGLEGALPDSVAQSILDNEMTPKLKAGDYDSAVTAGVRAIEQATKGEYQGTGASSSKVLDSVFSNAEGIVVVIIVVFQFLASIFARSRSWWAGGVVGLFGGASMGWILGVSLVAVMSLGGGLMLLGLLLDYFVSKGYANAKAHGVTPPWWTGGSGGRGGSGGFGGFGGGSSGGGGASGGW